MQEMKTVRDLLDGIKLAWHPMYARDGTELGGSVLLAERDSRVYAAALDGDIIPDILQPADAYARILEEIHAARMDWPVEERVDEQFPLGGVIMRSPDGLFVSIRITGAPSVVVAAFLPGAGNPRHSMLHIGKLHAWLEAMLENYAEILQKERKRAQKRAPSQEALDKKRAALAARRARLEEEERKFLASQ